MSASIATDTNKLDAWLAENGSPWKHPATGEIRIYIDHPEKYYGLELDFYRTGNIHHAELDGEKISNSSARAILTKLPTKCWYEPATGKFGFRFAVKYRNKRAAEADGSESDQCEIEVKLLLSPGSVRTDSARISRTWILWRTTNITRNGFTLTRLRYCAR